MTESLAEPEEPSTLNVALVSFTGCIGEAFDDVCSYGLTVGDAYVPFAPDEDTDADCDDDDCSQVWVRVMSTAMSPSPGWDDTCATVMTVELEVGILRCMPIIAEGEAPTASAMLGFAVQSMDDMNKILCAAMGCEVWNSIDAGQWNPLGPLGGQYGGLWTFTVEV